MSHLMAQAFYPLPNNWAGYPDGGSLHELAASKMHSQHVTILLVSSYLTFSPFRQRRASIVVFFFCITQPSRTASIFGSGMPYAARTFLFQFLRNRQRQTVRLLSRYKVKEK